MAILYNLDPLKAIEIYYGGERHGVWNGDFIKNEKKRGLVVPPPLREFLENYGYLSINRDENGYHLFDPDGMGLVDLMAEDEEIHLLVIGALNTLDSETEEEISYWVAVQRDYEELPAALGEETEDGVMWSPIDTTLEGIFSVMFCSHLYKNSDVYIYGELEMDAVMEARGIDPKKVLPSQGHPQHPSICYDEESGAFFVLSQYEDSLLLHIATRKSPEEEAADKYSSVSNEELEELFTAEFYMNALNCDFNHALELLMEIISRMTEAGADEFAFTEKYLLAGRCLWALNRFDEAEEWYKKGLPAIESSIEDHPEKAESYFEAMANFYFDTDQTEKSREMEARAMNVLLEYMPDDCYSIGSIYCDRAKALVERKGDPEEIIELCNKALEQFQKDPHDSGCKYEIARAQQMRGEARRRKKEMDKKKAENQ